MERKNRMRLFLSLGGVVVLLALSDCHRSGPSSGGKPQPARTVQTADVRVVDSEREVQVSGVVSGRHEANLTSRVGGRVTRILVRLGERVKKDQVLIELSGEVQSQALKAADANLAEAQKSFQRIDSLYRSQSATKSEWDRARQRLDVASAQDARARSLLGWTRVRAPFSGVVSRKVVRTGDVVGIGFPLVEILQDRNFQVFAHVPARWSKEIRVGQRVMFRVAEKGAVRGVPVVIREIAGGADPVSHTVLVRANAAAGAGSGLWSGQYGTMELPVGRDRIFLVPRQAVLDRDGLKEVFVVEDGKAYLRYIRTGTEHDGQIEVLSGLSDRETVVLSPTGDLENGSPVRVTGRP